MTKKEKRHNALQSLARHYLRKLQPKADKYGGLGDWVRETLKANKRNECEATRKEVYLLARCANEERIARQDIPKLFGISYRKAEESNLFDKIHKLGATGTYSRVSAMVESEAENG